MPGAAPRTKLLLDVAVPYQLVCGDAAELVALLRVFFVELHEIPERDGEFVHLVEGIVAE